MLSLSLSACQKFGPGWLTERSLFIYYCRRHGQVVASPKQVIRSSVAEFDVSPSLLSRSIGRLWLANVHPYVPPNRNDATIRTVGAKQPTQQKPQCLQYR